MKNVIEMVFELLAGLFDKVPFLHKLEGYRTVLGFAGLGVVAALKLKGIGDPAALQAVEYGLMGWVALSLNSKGR